MYTFLVNIDIVWVEIVLFYEPSSSTFDMHIHTFVYYIEWHSIHMLYRAKFRLGSTVLKSFIIRLSLNRLT